MKLLLLTAAIVFLSFAQSKTPVVFKASDFSTNLGIEPQAVPVAKTVVISGTSRLQPGSWISCNTLREITVTDGNGIQFMPGVTVNKAAVMSLNPFSGAVFPKSLSIQASGPGCFYHLIFNQ
jgi:hypothetical protein